jgi:HAUS augmin-like complex subunit 2
MAALQELLVSGVSLGLLSRDASDALALRTDASQAQTLAPAGAPATQQAAAGALAEALHLAEDACTLAELRCGVSRAACAVACAPLADLAAVHARCGAVSDAAAALGAALASKDSLAERLRTARTRPSVPVAPEHQELFAKLLTAAALGAGPLSAGLASLQWATTLTEPPSLWEDRLRAVLDAARELGCSLSALESLEVALRDAAKAAAVPSSL